MSTPDFDILNPSLNLYQNYFVEASAGCGKTFSIENAYLRLLLGNEEKLMSVQQILVLTFTREATKELRQRCRRTIEKALFELTHHEVTLPYLKQWIEEGEKSTKRAIRLLQDALSNFDQCQIFTLHGFCFRMLKENFFMAKVDIEKDFQDQGPAFDRIEMAMRDFLSFELSSSYLSSNQLRVLLKSYRGDFNQLLKKFLMELSKEKPALASPPFDLEAKSVRDQLEGILGDTPIHPKKVLEDAMRLASLYKGGFTRTREMYPPIRSALIRFSKLFDTECFNQNLDQFIWHSETFFKFFSSSNKKERHWNVPIHYPALWENLEEKIAPMIQSMASPDYLLSKLLSKAHTLYHKLLRDKGSLTPNNILENFRALLKNESVAKKIAQRFEAVIVDEFQDTDPTQWEILSSIFISHRPKDFPLYLVGDPKQSIYAFRSADIYTYLRAAKSLGLDNLRTLRTNYRSQPHLIDALNELFSSRSRDWIELPKTNEVLSYQEVKSSPFAEKRDYQDDRASLQFFVAYETRARENIPSADTEQARLFPYMVNEILRLHVEQKVPLKDFAILVKDRFQSERLKRYLACYQIPFISTRAEPLNGSPIVSEFYDLYHTVLNPKASGGIQRFKLSAYFPLYQKEEDLFKVLTRLGELRLLLFSQGFLIFYEALMNEPFLSGSLYEHILGLQDGLSVYEELEQIKQLLLQEELSGKDPYELLVLLKSLCEKNTLYEGEHLKRPNSTQSAVNILTLHMSKGLEYEVVFALGLANRTLSRSDLIPYEKDNQSLLIPYGHDPKHAEAHDLEMTAEKLRQLYVALTRAKQRLYIPVVWAKAVEDKKSAPIELFLKKLQLDPKKLRDFVASQSHMGLCELKETIEIEHSLNETLPSLIEPISHNVHLEKTEVHSFSSLAKLHKKSKDLAAPMDFHVQDKTIHTMPAGTETGVLYHTLLENLDFKSKSIDLSQELKDTPYADWRDLIEKHLLAVIHLPLKSSKHAFSLFDVDPNKMFKEIEFLYPVNNKNVINTSLKANDRMQGVIDLAFEYEGYYYLMDYKTNWLGPEPSDYEDLSKVMNEHEYTLQANIYKQAFKQYLKVFEERPFDECFGGVFYLFLRGIESKNHGIYLL